MNEQEQEGVRIARQIKKQMKKYSKNELISILIDQINRLMQQQHINQVLLERLKEYEKNT